MLPRVWSVSEFKKHSAKMLGARSLELQQIDLALGRAHTANLMTDAGTNALADLIQAIAKWRQAKQTQGRKSSRAAAVDTLQKQLVEAAEAVYQRKVGEQNRVERQVAAARTAIKQDLGQVGLGQGRAVKPMPPIRPVIPPRPPFHPPGGAPIGRPPQLQQPLRQPLQAQQPPVIGAPSPVSSVAQNRLFDYLAQALIAQRQKAMAFDDEDLFNDLDARQQGRLAAQWVLAVPPEVTDVAAARGEALRVLAAMLGNDVSVIKSLLQNQVEVVVVPRDKGMTALEQFASIRGQQTFDGRSWDSVRGVGNVPGPASPGGKPGKGASSIVAIDPNKGKIYTAVTEENLLGGLTTAPGGGCYATGYSTTTHEFAHSIHHYGLSPADRRIIDDAFRHRSKGFDHEEWVDGPRKINGQCCYAANNSTEYFAQLSNAWLGVNLGNDPYTQKPRNNGKDWVRRHEPRMLTDLLERIYGKAALDDLNPSVILKS